MILEELKTITLSTPIYHPFFGKGYPEKIEKTKISIRFNDTTTEFSSSGRVCVDRFLDEIHIHPVKVVIDF